jgi:poly(3-hydroxybutyrate) depolymerase
MEPDVAVICLAGRRAAAIWIAVALAAVLSACAAHHLTPRPEVYGIQTVTITQGDISVDLVLVRPTAPKPSPTLVVFASGDSGLKGISMSVFQHLADRGDHYVVGYSSRDVTARAEESGQRVPYAQAVGNIRWIIGQAKEKLGLPASAPVIVSGISRGANMVVLAASDSTMRSRLVGAVAIALTREFDHVGFPEGTRPPRWVQLDDQQRIQTYPAITRFRAVPVAIIQSTNDSYVPSAESRQLLGPDTPTRRLYEVESSNHSFAGAEDELLRALDDALNWIASRR